MNKSYTIVRYYLSPPQALNSSWAVYHRQQWLRYRENAPSDATEPVLHRRVTIISFIVITSSSKVVVNPSTSTLMQAERTKLRPTRNNNTSKACSGPCNGGTSRCRALCVGCTARRGSAPDQDRSHRGEKSRICEVIVSMCCFMIRGERISTYFLTSVYQ